CHGRLTCGQQIAKKRNGSLFQSVLPGLRQDHVPAHYVLGSPLNISHLSAQAFCEGFKPTSHIHPALAHALERFVISRPDAVVILADGEEPLEIVACPVKAKSRKQARRTSVAINKGMNVDELKLRDSRHDDWIYLSLPLQPCDKISHHLWDFERRWRRVRFQKSLSM